VIANIFFQVSPVIEPSQFVTIAFWKNFSSYTEFTKATVRKTATDAQQNNINDSITSCSTAVCVTDSRAPSLSQHSQTDKGKHTFGANDVYHDPPY
jgi:hypothetical protein